MMETYGDIKLDNGVKRVKIFTGKYRIEQRGRVIGFVNKTGRSDYETVWRYTLSRDWTVRGDAFTMRTALQWLIEADRRH